MNIIKRGIIRETILGMKQPFTRSDIVHKITSVYSNIPRGLVWDVLDELCDNEAVAAYFDDDNGHWVFSIVRGR